MFYLLRILEVLLSLFVFCLSAVISGVVAYLVLRKWLQKEEPASALRWLHMRGGRT